MKNAWLITFRSITFAQRGERALNSREIPCRLQRTPKSLTERGCGYCLRLREADLLPALESLQREKLSFEKVYTLYADGSTKEWAL